MAAPRTKDPSATKWVKKPKGARPPAPEKTPKPAKPAKAAPEHTFTTVGDWVALAEVARPHGVRGEVRLKVYNTDSDLLLAQEEVLVKLADGAEHEVSVDGSRWADQAVLLKLHGVDDRERAEEVRGAVIAVPRTALPKPDADEFYARDVVGCRVFVGGEGGEETLVGTVLELRTYPSVDTLAIARADKSELEVPLVSAYVASVDVEARVVRLATLDGLEE